MWDGHLKVSVVLDFIYLRKCIAGVLGPRAWALDGGKVWMSINIG